MATGLPVVGWRAGPSHLANDRVEGFAARPGDVTALSRALRRLAFDAELRQRMDAAVRRRAETLPAWEESALLIGGIREVLARGS